MQVVSASDRLMRSAMRRAQKNHAAGVPQARARALARAEFRARFCILGSRTSEAAQLEHVEPRCRAVALERSAFLRCHFMGPYWDDSPFKSSIPGTKLTRYGRFEMQRLGRKASKSPLARNAARKLVTAERCTDYQKLVILYLENQG